MKAQTLCLKCSKGLLNLSLLKISLPPNFPADQPYEQSLLFSPSLGAQSFPSLTHGDHLSALAQRMAVKVDPWHFSRPSCTGFGVGIAGSIRLAASGQHTPISNSLCVTRGDLYLFWNGDKFFTPQPTRKWLKSRFWIKIWKAMLETCHGMHCLLYMALNIEPCAGSLSSA